MKYLVKIKQFWFFGEMHLCTPFDAPPMLATYYVCPQFTIPPDNYELWRQIINNITEINTTTIYVCK